jgi:UDP-N-acetylmuramyl pentapeptide phosphotransferase/UDP-N-acetylglucosamine-1-phosphate transferase
VFGTFFFINDMLPYALFAFAMAGSLIAFLRYNYNPARIFMGDSGSLLLGLVNAILVMKFISVGDNSSLTYPTAVCCCHRFIYTYCAPGRYVAGV